jgi:hypothetical protein
MTWGRIWTDEKGNPSSARVLLWLWSGVITGVMTAHLAGVAFDQDLWPFMTTIWLSLIGWAGGPRVMEYLTGAVSAAASRVGTGRARPFGPPTTTHDDGK